MTLRTVVTELLTARSQRELADMVPCSPGLIGMLATGVRGRRTSFVIESRLRALHAAQTAGGDGQKQELEQRIKDAGE